MAGRSFWANLADKIPAIMGCIESLLRARFGNIDPGNFGDHRLEDISKTSFWVSTTLSTIVGLEMVKKIPCQPSDL